MKLGNVFDLLNKQTDDKPEVGEWETRTVWLFLGAVLIAAGALWQMWLESGAWRARLLSTLEALQQLSDEESKILIAAKGVRPWNVWKRREITREARGISFEALTPVETALLQQSDRAGRAWSLVCTGSLATALGAGLGAF